MLRFSRDFFGLIPVGPFVYVKYFTLPAEMSFGGLAFNMKITLNLSLSNIVNAIHNENPEEATMNTEGQIAVQCNQLAPICGGEQAATKLNSEGISRMQKVKRLMCFAMVVGCCVGLPKDALADAHCFCKLSCYNQSGQTSFGSVLKDYGWLATYTGINQQGQANQNACATLCANTASADTGSQALATAACAMGCPNGSVIKAYSAVGNKAYRDDQLSIGTLINTPPVTKTTYDCNGLPGTWLDNPSTGNGGHARCIKNSCDAVAGVPAAPSWTSIGTAWSSATGAAWLTDGSGDIWYGVPAHATTTVVSPAQCHF